MFVPGKPFQPSITVAGKAGAYPSEAPIRFSSIGLAPGLTLEKFAGEKHSTLLRKFENHEQKSFITLYPV